LSLSEQDIIGLCVSLVFLILLSGFFSGSETGMMSVNRYRLRHLVRDKNKHAKRVQSLLERPDRLLGVILIGNTFANVVASAIATILAVHWFGEVGVVFATLILTILILIFAEIAPKTLAVHNAMRFAFFVSLPLKYLLTLFYPLVFILTSIANTVLRLCGVKLKHGQVAESLNKEELRTVVHETQSSEQKPGKSDHKDMLLGVLDLEHITIDDAMVPRGDITGINLEEDWTKNLKVLMESPYTQFPVYEGSIDSLKGVLHRRDVLKLMQENRLNQASLVSVLREPYFIPEGTSLSTQLMHFRQQKRRHALVVDEYGEIIGLIALEDILEEIVGELDTDVASIHHNVTKQRDGSYIIDATVQLRELNKYMDWHFPVDGPKTLGGLIIEQIETLPEGNVGTVIGDYLIEVLSIKDNRILRVKVKPREKTD
jgi:Mg2+/Co2+ transporter CorB